MRSRLFFSVVVVLAAAGCGGNWSNTDLAFANALPRSADLKSRIPAGTTAQPLEGVATRRDGLMVGDPSNAWALTRKAATDYNGMLDSLLGLVDQVRTIAPSSRTADSRTWGPFADSNNPGREVQLTIKQVDAVNFEWAIESRPTNGAFLRILTGNFRASETARKGQGAIRVFVKDFRDVVKVDQNLAQLDQIDVGYVTDMFPRRVEMLFTAKPGGTLALSSLGYTSREKEDGAGAMRFVSTSMDANASEIQLDAVWKPTGEGKAQGVVTKGTYAGATVSECWNTSGRVVFYAESWAGGTTSGSPADCAVIDGF